MFVHCQKGHQPVNPDERIRKEYEERAKKSNNVECFTCMFRLWVHFPRFYFIYFRTYMKQCVKCSIMAYTPHLCNVTFFIRLQNSKRNKISTKKKDRTNNQPVSQIQKNFFPFRTTRIAYTFHRQLYWFGSVVNHLCLHNILSLPFTINHMQVPL